MAKILFFSPHAAIWVHAFPEALLAESLQASGHDIVYITCGETLRRYCVAMSAHGLAFDSTPDQKAAICGLCRIHEGLLRVNLQLPGYTLDSMLEPEDRTWAEATLASLPTKGFEHFEVEGLPLGRIALYHMLLQVKKIDLEFNELEWALYRVEVLNALLALAAVRRIYERERPDRVVTYNALYPVHRIMHAYAEARGVPCYSLHAGQNLAHRLQRIFLTRHFTFDFFRHQISAWPRFRELPCGREDIAQTGDHLLTLLQGTSNWAYSTARREQKEDLRARFGIPEGAKVVVATMSSYDERYAAEAVQAVPSSREGLLFPRQVDWIQAVVEFVKARTDLFFIIRVHPREFRGEVSQHALELQRLFDDLPGNVAVNWPSDEVSIFDLAEITDLFLNAWSSAGKEMAFLGIPVLLYSPDLVLYPPELNFVAADSLSHYFLAFEEALAGGWQASRILEGFRWYSLEHGRSLFDLTCSFPLSERSTISPALRDVLASVIPQASERLDCYFRAASLPQAQLLSTVMEQGTDSLLDLVDPGAFPSLEPALELELVRKEIGRLLETWHGGQSPADPQGLHARLKAFAEAT